MQEERPPVILDCGTGFTKIGYAGHFEPSAVVPTSLARHKSYLSGKRDYIFVCGNQAESRRKDDDLEFHHSALMDKGRIQDFDGMEKFWIDLFANVLNVESETQSVVLTEPPLNPSKNREFMCEVFFETLNVPNLHIGIQAVFSMLALNPRDRSVVQRRRDLTGIGLDSGDGVTHAVSVVNGYVWPSAIQEIPLGGRNLTRFIIKMLRARDEEIPQGREFEIANRIKEKHCYVCREMKTEFSKYDEYPEKYFNTHADFDTRTKAGFTINIGYERFLAPEILFDPEIFFSRLQTSIPDLIHEACVTSPLDFQRQLANNVCLSGGSTLFPRFNTRLLEVLKKKFSSSKVKNPIVPTIQYATSVRQQRFAVWMGASELGSDDQFREIAHSKRDYEEYGASALVRKNWSGF